MELVVVESKAKAKTIQRYLGSDFIVMACNGHVQDLPNNKNNPDGRKAMWAASEDELPSPPWEWTERSKKVITEMRRRAKDAKVTEIHVATDPDREGEFIAWRLAELLGSIAKVNRIVFNEITKTAIKAALADPAGVDMQLVEAAKVRRFMDRLVGFRTSKFARSWGLKSMGRVQTPTLGFVVDKEIEREAFVPTPYFAVNAIAEGIEFGVRFHESADDDAWRDDKGKFNSRRTFDGDLARLANDSLVNARVLTVSTSEQKQEKKRPRPPFTTDALLQTAGSSLNWTPAATMIVAGELYNAGHITYMRTDSTRTSGAARESMKEYIESTWGADHVGAGVMGPKAKGNVQDAHEAIRPTRTDVVEPEELSSRQSRLYKFIWARFAASQMTDSRYERISLTCTVDGFDRPLAGSIAWRVHTGWEAAFADITRKQPRTEPPTFDTSVGARLDFDDIDDNPELIEDETKPPRRFRQHTLVAEMKERGIGRPSTYATTISKLIDREYVKMTDGSLIPTDSGRLLWTEVATMYTETAEGNGAKVAFLFSAAFTSDMEERLDLVEAGERTGPSVWHGFVAHFKQLHGLALEQKRSRPTPNQVRKFLQVVSRRTEAEVSELLGGREIEELSGAEISSLIGQELEKGSPPATEKQTKYVLGLCEELEVDLKEALTKVKLEDIDALTMETASELITHLREIQDERPRPSSEKQLALIEKQAEKAELSEQEACALVELNAYDELTGGRGGTASGLITILLKRNNPGGRKGRRRRKR
jgi:DNA topoisomerase-1